MKILAVSAFFPPDTVGGYEWAAYEILFRLAARGHEVLVLAGRPEQPVSEIEQARLQVRRRLDRVQVCDRRQSVCAKIRATLAYVRNYHCILAAAREFSPDVLYVWAGANLTPAVPAAAENSGMPAAFHLEDTWLESARGQRGSGLLAGAAAALRSALAATPRYDVSDYRLIFVSDALRREYAAGGWDRVAAVVVHNGCEVPGRLPERRRCEGQYCIGYAGRLHPNKGVRELLLGLEKLERAGVRNWRAEICGAGEAVYVDGLQALAKELGLEEKLRWRGALPRRELLAKYAEFDLLAVPSVWAEPFGLVAVEALACGVPVLAARRGGLPEIVDESCGWLCEPEPESLAAALGAALADPDALLARGAAGRERAKRCFSWDEKTAQAEEFLTRCVAELRPGNGLTTRESGLK